METGTLNETCYDHVRGEDYFTMTAAETWSIAMVKRLQSKYSDKVHIRHTTPDGSMVVRLPFEWMRIVPKREDTLTEEQRAARRDGMATVRAQRHRAPAEVNGPNSDE